MVRHNHLRRALAADGERPAPGPQPIESAPTILCVASFFKGNEFIRESCRQGGRVVLLTREKLRDAAWARESLDDLIALPAEADGETYLAAVNFVAARRTVARVVALEEYDVELAARIREHLCLSGMGTTTAHYFQDKLAMRTKARASGILVPDFVHLLNHERVAEFLARVPPPWMLKPRRGASAMGIRQLDTAEQVWRTMMELDAREDLHEQTPAHLLERFVPGDVYHVDALVCGGRVVFTSVERYGAPPFEVAHQGGVSTSHTVQRGAQDERRLVALNEQLLTAFGLVQGVAHTEFIRAAADGECYFLETAARVGGAYTAETVAAATGINLWREWARIELATPERPYTLPPLRADYGGLILSLARQEHPDTSAYDDPEIAYRIDKPWHAGLVVRAADHARVVALCAQYARRFSADFTAAAPAEETPAQYL
jgi:biotin carboxylase